MNAIKISLNGLAVPTQATTVLALLQEREYPLNSAMACALNQRFVPRSQWAQQALQAGDRIDLIAPIAGG